MSAEADELEFKTLPGEFKLAGDDGTIEGYASVFDVVDLGRDSVARGAFAKSLVARKPKMLWQHSSDQPIGVWDEAREDDRGLFVKGRLLQEVQQGREALALLKAGAIDGLSIGYRAITAATDAGGRIRKLLEVELHEISIVTNPMLPSAKVHSVKSADGRFDPKLMERALRDVCGLSISEAKAFMADGFKGLKTPRDVGASEADAGVKALLLQLRQLQEKIHV